jgi:hypothetical protein
VADVLYPSDIADSPYLLLPNIVHGDRDLKPGRRVSDHAPKSAPELSFGLRVENSASQARPDHRARSHRARAASAARPSIALSLVPVIPPGVDAWQNGAQ